MDNKDIYMELLDIGYQQDQTIKMVKDSASILQSLVEAASAPTVQQELPDIVIPDTVTISNLPEIQKVEVINEKTLELDKIESLLLQLLKAVPTIKDERPTPTEDVRKLLILLSQDKSKDKVLELLTQILQKEYPAYQLPDNIISKEGRIKVEVDRAGGLSGAGLLTTAEYLAKENEVLTLLIDDVAPLLYIGEAEPGTLTSAAGWRVKRIDSTNDPDITIKWASQAFDQVWDDRTTLTYY